MVHMPMVPFKYPEINPSNLAIYSDMTYEEIKEQLDKNINSILDISGINNQWGQK